ncbi:hypothetical protein Acor_67020 [Acrocarpospora corrugata]|uniref:Uncharacterized protein n=1 Tax=Acrocarpospora corrugata TaxID=35763 RepID=A0A5M3W739_9ACTN|nr:hypothetical protein Acor_67020 [Acrocarpospora corrugata]
MSVKWGFLGIMEIIIETSERPGAHCESGQLCDPMRLAEYRVNLDFGLDDMRLISHALPLSDQSEGFVDDDA